jgi:hypothetical protein
MGAFLKLTALLSIVPTILLANCTTTTSSVTAVGAHPDLPANYRQQIAAFMRTQMFAHSGISGAEISDPNRTFAGLVSGGDRDIVCVRIGGPLGTVRAYTFIDGKLSWDTGGIVGQSGMGVLTERWGCGENPNFKPYPEADYRPRV